MISETTPSIPLSVLDLAHVADGSIPADSLKHSLDLAQHAESWGYLRYWLAEHHNMVGIASAATSVLIGYIASGTKTIRVGSGGIMLPNHSPLVIAEQFGTLESLYPGRIDLGLGRAPGTDGATFTALRRNMSSADTFPQDVAELQSYFAEPQPGQGVLAVPGAGLKVPLWILGSSLFGAQLAAQMGLPYAFASHFAPDALHQAIKAYRQNFKPSEQLSKPYVMVTANITVADTDEEAAYLFTSTQQLFLNLIRGRPRQMPRPVDHIESLWNTMEKAQVSHMLEYAIVGSPKSVNRKLNHFVESVGADEVIATSAIYDHQAKLHSYELLADAASQ